MPLIFHLGEAGSALDSSENPSALAVGSVNQLEPRPPLPQNERPWLV